MSSADWDEVKRLAADFQRAQLTAAAQRLTERNCVEIVNKLIELKLLDVVFTSDGKEYVTPHQLGKEIMDELYVNGGRLPVVDLAATLNVSLGVITSRVNDLLKTEKGLHLVLGQLITTVFLDSYAHEVNEKLIQDGVVSLNDLSKTSDIPGDFLMEQMIRRVGKIIKGKQDETENWMIYTETFVQRNTAKLRGILSGIMRPTPLHQIMHKVNLLSEKLFFTIVKKLLSTKRVDGVLSGSTKTSYYIPSIYTRAQVNYIEKFMNGNGYVDLDAAARLGISEPKSFVQTRFPNQELVFLKTSCLGEQLFRQVKDSVEESLISPGWVDVGSLLPFGISEDEVGLLLQQIPRSPDSITIGSCIISSSLVDSIKDQFRPLMTEQSAKDIESGKYVEIMTQIRAAEKKAKTAALNAVESDTRGHKKDDRRKKASSGKAGGGAQGRETKTKSTKKKYMTSRKEDSDSEDDEPKHGSHESSSKQGLTVPVLSFLSQKDVIKKLEKEESLVDAPQEILKGIANRILPPLQQEYQIVVKKAYDAFVSEQVGRKSKDELLVKAKKLVVFMKLYAKGLDAFENEDVKPQLEKYLLRNFCQEVINGLTEYFLVEAGIQDGKINDLEDQTLVADLLDLSRANTASDFIRDVEKIFQVRGEKDFGDVLTEARESLQSQLGSAEESGDPALFLHVFVLLAFSLTNKCLISASGKFVPQIIQRLGKDIGTEELTKLKHAQDAVIHHIKSKGTQGQVDTIYEDLKNILKVFRKGG